MKKITSILACLLALLFIVGVTSCDQTPKFSSDPNEYLIWETDEDGNYLLPKKLEAWDGIFVNYTPNEDIGTVFDDVGDNEYPFVIGEWASSVKALYKTDSVTYKEKDSKVSTSKTFTVEDGTVNFVVTSTGWWGFALTQLVDPSSSDIVNLKSYLDFSKVEYIEFFIKSDLKASNIWLQMGSLTKDPLRQVSLANYTWDFTNDISDWTRVRIPVSSLQKTKMRYLALGQRVTAAEKERNDQTKTIEIRNIAFLGEEDEQMDIGTKVTFDRKRPDVIEEGLTTEELIDVKGLELVWNEQFDSLNNWHFDLGKGNDRDNTDNTFANNSGWGNIELQSYEGPNPDNPEDTNANVYIGQSSNLKGNSMYIVAKKSGDNWTSGRPVTRNKVEGRYGYIEMSAKITDAYGFWPAFWMLRHDVYDDNGTGWPVGGELDIMESSYTLWGEGTVKGTLHTEAGHGGSPIYLRQVKPLAAEGLEEAFHTYGIYWTDKYIVWYYDGEPRFVYQPTDYKNARWPFDEEFYLILNLACGGLLGGDNPTVNKATMEIDYIRWYQNPSLKSSTFNKENREEFPDSEFEVESSENETFWR